MPQSQIINCDTLTPVSYSLEIAPLISAKCVSCHGASMTISLFNYNSIKQHALANPKSIYNSVARNGLAMPMPPNSTLSECEIIKIRRWTEAGAPNN